MDDTLAKLLEPSELDEPTRWWHSLTEPAGRTIAGGGVRLRPLRRGDDALLNVAARSARTLDGAEVYLAVAHLDAYVDVMLEQRRAGLRAPFVVEWDTVAADRSSLTGMPVPTRLVCGIACFVASFEQGESRCSIEDTWLAAAAGACRDKVLSLMVSDALDSGSMPEVTVRCNSSDL
jgi:hypothetical protein